MDSNLSDPYLMIVSDKIYHMSGDYAQLFQSYEESKPPERGDILFREENIIYVSFE